MSTDPVIARRDTVARICEAAAGAVVDRIVHEASNAANMFGLSPDRARGYGDGIRGTLPAALVAMRMPDGPERDAAIDDTARRVRAVSESGHIPHIVERGLVAITYRITREVIRRRADGTGFTPDELEHEFVLFGEQLQRQLFALSS